MSVMQNYGVLRIVGGSHGSRGKVVRLESSMRENAEERGEGDALPLRGSEKGIRLRHRYLGRWLPDERLVHIVSQQETMIGRALSSDIILWDPTVSREHVRLVLGEDGWSVQNVTENNVVRVNGQVVAGGAWSPLQPQDLLVIGNATLQLVAPLPDRESLVRMNGDRPSGGMRALSGALALGKRRRRFFVVGVLLSVVVIAGVLLVLRILSSLSGLAQDGTHNLVLALIVPLIPAVSINILVNFMDRYGRDPWFLRLAAFLWGAIIAIPPALFIENFMDGFIIRLWGGASQLVLHALFSALGAGLTEETVKGLGLLLLFFVLREKFDNITDGIVYGALIGAGFAMVENFIYFLWKPNDMSALIVGRIVLGWFSHSTFTICFGVALGYIRHTRVRWRQSVVPLLGYLLAAGLHTIFDFVEIFVRDLVPTYGNSPAVTRFAILAVIGNYIPLFVVQVGILFILIKSLMHEAAIIRDFLPSEVAGGVVTVEEYALLPHSFARIRLERLVLWRYGVRQWWLTRALYQAEIGLAFCKWHASMLRCSGMAQGNEESLGSLCPPSDVDNGNGTLPGVSKGILLRPPDFVPGYLQPEVAYRKRIKRIRAEIASLEVKRVG